MDGHRREPPCRERQYGQACGTRPWAVVRRNAGLTAIAEDASPDEHFSCSSIWSSTIVGRAERRVPREPRSDLFAFLGAGPALDSLPPSALGDCRCLLALLELDLGLVYGHLRVGGRRRVLELIPQPAALPGLVGPTPHPPLVAHSNDTSLVIGIRRMVLLIVGPCNPRPWQTCLYLALRPGHGAVLRCARIVSSEPPPATPACLVSAGPRRAVPFARGPQLGPRRANPRATRSTPNRSCPRDLTPRSARIPAGTTVLLLSSQVQPGAGPVRGARWWNWGMASTLSAAVVVRSISRIAPAR